MVVRVPPSSLSFCAYADTIFLVYLFLTFVVFLLLYEFERNIFQEFPKVAIADVRTAEAMDS